MAERAVFLDRDNTIIDDPDGYIGEPTRVKLIAGAAAAIVGLRRMGYRIIVASNQSGVARGMFDEAAVDAVNEEMNRQLREQAGAHIDASYYCPYHPDATVPEYKAEHEWRKPQPGMLLQAARDFELDLAQCWMIGDGPRDMAAGAAAGCRTILLQDPERVVEDPDKAPLAVSPNFIVKSLADAARIIAREGRNPHPDLVPVPLAQTQPAASAEAAPAEAADANRTVEAAAPTPRESVSADKAGSLRPVLDEILVQIRQQNRAHDSHEFSLHRLLAAIAQVLAVVCVILAAWDVISIMPPQIDQAHYWLQIHVMLRAALWLLAGIFLQALTISLQVTGRR